jgi:hypothetical protein
VLGLGGCWIKYRMWNISLDFMTLINLVVVIIWLGWEILIKISDELRGYMYNFKRRIYNLKIIMIIISMQQVKKHLFSIFRKRPKVIYNKQYNVLEKTQF